MKTEKQILYRINMLKEDLKELQVRYKESDGINNDWVNIRVIKALIMELDSVLNPTIFLGEESFNNTK